MNLIFILFTLLLPYGFGFNLETRLPVIKRRNLNNSYFGFSVAEHQEELQTNGLRKSWILVGAPRDQNLQPSTKQSGALWRCPLTTLETDCEQVITDGRREDIDGFSHFNNTAHLEGDLQPPREDEIKDDQWMGVVVRSDGPGKKVLVCAHRYIQGNLDFRHIQGLCYSYNYNLQFDQSLEGCKGMPTERMHEDYGVCQFGTSAILVNDTAIIGAPGSESWKGILLKYSLGDDIFNNLATDPIENPVVDKYSYLGMSVSAGNFYGNQMAVATGAPRSKEIGEVITFHHENAKYIQAERLSGEQIASNFGYELCSADVNGDRLTDLIVGAPNYFFDDIGGAAYVYLNKNRCLKCLPPTKLTGKLESRFGIALANLGDLNKDGYEDIAIGAPYEGKGVVYIYLGSKDGLVTKPSQVISGETYGLETFGYSLSGGVDMDMNGYPDLLAGAFESSAVVLLRARPIIGLEVTISPEGNLTNINPASKGCAHHKNSVHTCFVFTACVKVPKISESVQRDNSQIKLKYKLETDIYKIAPRVWVHRHHSRHSHNKSHVYTHEIDLVYKPRERRFEHCHQETIFLKDSTTDIQSPIAMRLSYWLVQVEPTPPKIGDPLPSVDKFPILNQMQADHEFKASFLKDCGSDNICESDLSLQASLTLPKIDTNQWRLDLGEHDEVILKGDVHNFGESAYEAQLLVSHPITLSYIGSGKHNDSAITQAIACAPFNRTFVLCSIGNPLKKDKGVNVNLRFDPSGVGDTEPKLEITVSVNTTSHDLKESNKFQTLHALIRRRAQLSLRGQGRPEQVFYGGEVKGESAMNFKEDIGARVLHMYQVENRGPWRVNNFDLIVYWPFQVANDKPLGKWLLYIDEKPYVESEGERSECAMASGQVNPLNLRSQHDSFLAQPYELRRTVYPSPQNVTTSTLVRKRREIEKVVRSDPYIDQEGRRHEVINMNCDRGSAKCFRFTCSIYNFKKNQEATVFIKARLWNSTLVEDYPHAYFVKIASKASIQINPSLVIEQDTTDDTAEVETVARYEPSKQQTVEDVPLWIILIACVFGILLFLLLVVVLWKLGFFKRRRPDPTLSGNLEKYPADDYHDY